MNIGRRIYFDKSTGVVITEVGERSGGAVKTTIEDDIIVYTELSERNRTTFDFIELAYGELSSEFNACTSFRINPTTKSVEFNYDDMFTTEDYRRFKKEEIMSWYNEDLTGIFITPLVNADGIPYEFLYDIDSQMKINGQTNKLNLLLSRLSLGQITQVQFDNYFPIYWRTANLGMIAMSYEDYLVFADEVENHERSLLTKRMQLEGYVDTLTTKEEIEAVTW